MTHPVRRWRRSVLPPSVIVGALSLCAVVALYWLMALRPGTNPALVPAPPQILQTLVDELRTSGGLERRWYTFV